ncbi:uncharacterized protein [Elaeis guineensis]|uniref:Uncharacterized protein LOC105041384 n=1 Tax=Elaeis guineensis var. tenera TaxID=51953 RepID=A0A6I9QWY0_ELAGV|nr:uncharacterized protein LOC105041384 [Elaeis guineensis]
MEWKKSYLDLILVPIGLLSSILYHIWLWQKIRSQPQQTFIGINSAGRRLWVIAMMKENDKKNVLAVQTIRNAIMGSTLMATTSILLCCGLAAMISSTYSIKQPLNDSVYGAHGQFVVAFKYVALLFIYICSFVCYSLSIRFIGQVNFLINVPQGDDNSLVTPDYISNLLEKAFALNIAGNRLFYAGLPIILWIFGPVVVLTGSLSMLPILYNMDIANGQGRKGGIMKEDKVDGKTPMAA